MRIWIDGDAAPRAVKDIVFRTARRLNLQTTLVANQRIEVPLNNPYVHVVRVAGGPDMADQHIVDHSEPGDLTITADIPLAAALVEKNVLVVDPRGEEYTKENVRERLSIRDFMEDLRNTGVATGGPAPYGHKQKQAFAGALDRLLTRVQGERS